MIISTTITRNKKPSQAVYQMANPEPPVQNELKVNSEVVLNNDEDNTQDLLLKNVEPIQDVSVEKDEKLITLTEETEQTNTSGVVEEGKTETLQVQEQSSEQEQIQEQASEQEPELVQESEQPQIEKTEEAPKKKTSSKKK